MHVGMQIRSCRATSRRCVCAEGLAHLTQRRFQSNADREFSLEGKPKNPKNCFGWWVCFSCVFEFFAYPPPARAENAAGWWVCFLLCFCAFGIPTTRPAKNEFRPDFFWSAWHFLPAWGSGMVLVRTLQSTAGQAKMPTLSEKKAAGCNCRPEVLPLSF